MNALRGITQPFMGVRLSKKYEKKIEKKRTAKAGDISFDKRKTLLPEILRIIFSLVYSSVHSITQ
jgi:hypothetical protein